MSKNYRFILFISSIAIFLLIGYLTVDDFFYRFDNFWLSSGILLLILLSLIDQPHFSKDSNIFVNAVTASISLLLIKENDKDWYYYTFVFITGYLVITSYALFWIRNNPLNEEKKLVQLTSRINRILGKPDTLFSAFFLWGAIKQFGLYSTELKSLFWFWVVFILLNIPQVAKSIELFFEEKSSQLNENILGLIFGVQSKNTFLVKLLPEKPIIKLFDFVEFKYSVDEKIRKGIIFDVYLLNQEQWVKILSNAEIEKIFEGSLSYENHKPDVVYKIKNIPSNDYINRFVGIVTENSTINKIRFIFNSKVLISEGQLLEVTTQSRKILYQIVEGITKIEQLENKNQTGLIIGEAIQLGTWNHDKTQFEQFGWVPEINSPVYLATNVPETKIEDNEYQIGNIPNTNYPVIINKDVAITHHTAVVGVTGTGKSIFSRNLIREYLKDQGTKVICIDFTGEYIGKFSDLNPKPTINELKSSGLFKKIDQIERELADNYNKDTDNTIKLKKEVASEMLIEIEAFLKGSEKISIFELPHVENTSGVLTYTKNFFRLLFHIAKTQKNFGKKVCLVLEEAHTIIPEWNFSGISDKVSQPLLNSIAQIALQGRKYNVGLLVIAQRTANVSKTILTQCNTIISFQEFDKTSSEFLANYFGTNIAGALPNLKFKHAIAAGKAFKSNVPIIFEVPEIKEPDSI
ncbi:ATP-binding protein [Leptospira yanagawae]|uniref:ATP-binding protein n=1 Tax=Leptospira yanagawae TaxID=293069 RepID=A0ABY2M3K0_9LEPT|nr:DUF87 domain-containing protein [Leptospira yanagawae]TGL23068.1 ATP-binding protein [Leptospira yanagawae]